MLSTCPTRIFHVDIHILITADDSVTDHTFILRCYESELHYVKWVKENLVWVWKEGFVIYLKILFQCYIKELEKNTNDISLRVSEKKFEPRRCYFLTCPHVFSYTCYPLLRFSKSTRFTYTALKFCCYSLSNNEISYLYSSPYIFRIFPTWQNLRDMRHIWEKRKICRGFWWRNQKKSASCKYCL